MARGKVHMDFGDEPLVSITAWTLLINRLNLLCLLKLLYHDVLHIVVQQLPKQHFTSSLYPWNHFLFFIWGLSMAEFQIRDIHALCPDGLRPLVS